MPNLFQQENSTQAQSTGGRPEQIIQDEFLLCLEIFKDCKRTKRRTKDKEGHTNYPLFSLSTYAINEISKK